MLWLIYGVIIGTALGAGILEAPGTAWAQGATGLSYGGRLTTPGGDAIRGPVNLEVRLFATASGGTPLWSQSFGSVPLDSGVFQVDLGNVQAILSSPSPLFVEVTDSSNGVVYPRQRITAVPYALRTPVDGSSLIYGADGRLTIGTIDASKVTGLNAGSVVTANSVLEPKSVSSRGAGAVAIRPDGATRGDLRFYGGSGSYVGFRAPTSLSSATALVWDLPASDGIGGQYLATNGEGQLIWSTPTGAGDMQKSANLSDLADKSQSRTNLGLGALATANTVSSDTIVDGSITDSDLHIFAGITDVKLSTITTVGKVSGSAITSGSISGSTTVSTTGSISAPSITASTALRAASAADLRFGDADDSHFVGFKAPGAVITNHIWTLPASDGTSGQVLSTNGSGSLFWTSAGSQGTVTSVGIVGPSEGIAVANSPITGSGTINLSLNGDLAAIESLSGTGGVERTGTNTWGTYALTAAGKALIDDADAAAQRTTLGLSALATASAVSGGTGGAIIDGTITDADINTNAAIAQSKIQGLTSTLAGKEPSITGGASTQYYRGDKTWQNLTTDAVTEGTSNRYFTLQRARSALSASPPLVYDSSSGVLGLDLPGIGGGAASHPSSGCPTGYIAVPGDTDYGTSNFCVMKYEAKFGLKGASSQAAGLPARGVIGQSDARSACRNLGPGYALINNAEWMTLATNITNVNSNWSGGTRGTGALNRGHSDNSPANPLAAAMDSDPCNGTGQSCNATTWNDQRRTHTLSNGEVIWDLAGNVWEWVDYNNFDDKPIPAGVAFYEYTGVTGSTTMPKTELIPSGKAWWVSTWNGATNGIGQYYGGANSSGGALLRGAGWFNGTGAGVFAAYLNSGPSETYPYVGFRCVFRPSVP